MSVFTRFADRLSAATDAATQRAMLVELSQWRAQQLTDVPAQREAAWAMSQLYARSGDEDAAVREARMLLTLCTTNPEAPGAQIKVARDWLKGLGGKLPPQIPGRNTRNERPSKGKNERRERGPTERGARGARAERDDRAPKRGSAADVAAEITAGRTRNARNALRGRNDDRSALLNLWIDVLELQQAPAGDFGKRLADIEQSLATRLRNTRPTEAPAQAAPKSARPAGPQEQALAELMGQALPHKRRERAELFDSYAAANTDKIDAFAALALRAHVEGEGDGKPAPWLVGHVALALASGEATDTRAALSALSKRGSFAVSAYDEPAFATLVDVLRTALSDGAAFTTLRRGVLSRGEPADRKVWTLRVTKDGTERQIAAASPATTGLEGDTADRIAARLHQLCPHTLLVADGEGNTSLNAAFTARSGSVATGAAAAVWAAALEVEAVVPEPPAPRAARSSSAANDAASRDATDAAWAALVGAAERPSREALDAALASFRRVHHALRPLWELTAPLGAEEQAVRVVDALEAAVAAAPGARLSEVIDLGVRVRAAQPDAAALIARLDADSLADFAGKGVDVVGALTGPLVAAGVEVRRILRGLTGKERRSSDVLDAVAPQLESLWRLQLTVNERRRELWVVAALPPEAVAGLPLLLDGAIDPVVVVPVEGDLLDAWRTIGGPEPIGFTGDEVADVVEAVKG